MRTTVTIDDDLLDSARELSGVNEVPALVRLALQHYVEREAARQLAKLGGSAPELQASPRRRPPGFLNDSSGTNERPPIYPRSRRHAAE